MKNSGNNSGGGHRYRPSRKESDHHDSHQNSYTNNNYKNSKDNTVSPSKSVKDNITTKAKSSNELRTVIDPARPSISYWTKFFTEAGFSSQLAEEYSLIFAKHRIRSDMMNELNKEILSEMGIKAMGDIIAIVRQAKNQANLDEVGEGNAIVEPQLKSNGSRNPNYVADRHQQTQKTTNDDDNKFPIIRGNNMNQSNQRVANTTNKQISLNQQAGTKIKSRLSLTSGALRSSSPEKPHSDLSNIDNNNYHRQHNTNNDDDDIKNTHNSNKRASSTSKLSNSLAKRLCPELPYTEPKKRLGEEKTLVVHYPSAAAMARARQRISGSTKPDSRQDTSDPVPRVELSSLKSTSSIKSRLGQISLKANQDRRQ